MVWGRPLPSPEREKMVASVRWRPWGYGEADGFTRELEGKFSRTWGWLCLGAGEGVEEWRVLQKKMEVTLFFIRQVAPEERKEGKRGKDGSRVREVESKKTSHHGAPLNTAAAPEPNLGRCHRVGPMTTQ